MQALADGLAPGAGRLVVVGDTKSPAEFRLAGARFFSIEEQRDSRFAFARLCPTRHYARKNLGYLLALQDGASLIQETDDDNMPVSGFFDPVERHVSVPVLRNVGWTNIYRYFSDAAIWPRGLPLDEIHAELPAFDSLPTQKVDCPIQQGLADGNPDVDAVFRLVSPMDVRFLPGRRLALGRDAWCPFNSQNTIWFADAFPLLYLPAYCSFRMTDIWRSFVAQRIAWENDWAVLFHHATVWQGRNPHDLMRDFVDEIPGYVNNRRIATALSELRLTPGQGALAGNLLQCYGALVGLGIVGEQELPLLRSWLSDIGL
ncbi:MAG: STELLO glycosyltransferase family protein [Rhizomicrobium sp.]|jgi:hypothetical protein